MKTDDREVPLAKERWDPCRNIHPHPIGTTAFQRNVRGDIMFNTIAVDYGFDITNNAQKEVTDVPIEIGKCGVHGVNLG
jgi:hypothetical protein